MSIDMNKVRIRTFCEGVNFVKFTGATNNKEYWVNPCHIISFSAELDRDNPEQKSVIAVVDNPDGFAIKESVEEIKVIIVRCFF